MCCLRVDEASCDATRRDATRHDAAPRGATLVHVCLAILFPAFALERIDTFAGTSRHADDDGARAKDECRKCRSLSRSNTRKSPLQLQGRRARRPCRHRQGTTNVIDGPRTYRGLATGGGNGRRGARQRRRHRFPIVKHLTLIRSGRLPTGHSVGGRRRRRALVD